MYQRRRAIRELAEQANLPIHFALKRLTLVDNGARVSAMSVGTACLDVNAEHVLQLPGDVLPRKITKFMRFYTGGVLAVS